MPTNKRWIKDAIGNDKGKLRKKLHVKEGKNIPLSKIKQAEKSKNPTLRREAHLAETLRKIPRRKKATTKR